MAVAPTTERRRRRITADPGPTRGETEVQAPQERVTGMVASAAQVPLDNLGWDKPRSQQPWQRELWRLLEIVGELKFAAGWVASQASQAVLRMHDVDDDGEIGGETTNEQAQKIAGTLFGKAAERREILRMASFNLWLAGETYIGALSATGPRGRDEWFAVSVNDIKREPGGRAYVDLGQGKRYLTPGKDLLLRCWTPHPDRAAEADSSARSVRIILRELEKLTLYIFAQIDSRLASGGVFVVPSGMSTADGEVTATDLMRSFVQTASEALKGEGTAAGIVPIVLEVPPDALGKLQYLTFTSDLSQQALKLREEAATRLGRDLDLPVEEVTGLGDTNHWSSFQIGPDAVKKHIEPLLSRLCLALQRGWVDHALEQAGLDPDRFHIWYDVTRLIVRPQRFQEALDLWRAGVLSSKAMLAAASFYDSDLPGEEEDVKRWLRELVLRDPQMFNQASIRALVGVTEEMMPASEAPQDTSATGSQQLITDSGTPPPPPPAPETAPVKPVTGRVPVSRQRKPGGVAASAAVLDPTPLALMAVADAVSLRALELAGGRLLDHRTRGVHRDVPRHELHTVIRVEPDADMDKLLGGWSTTLSMLASTIGVAEDAVEPLTGALRRHCEATLLSGQPHNRERMIGALQIAGLINGFE